MDGESSGRSQSPPNSGYYGRNSSLSCISCEWRIDDKYHWMESYQALYLTPNGTQLSDVYIVDLYWLEADYTPDGELDFEKLGPWWVMANSKPAKAFLVHSCCWSLLIKHFPNEEVNLDRLFEVCKNRPSSRGPKYWSLDYVGGINEEPWYPPQRPIIRGIGDATKQLSKVQRLEIGYSNTTHRSDCFSSLAIEIRLEIASYLSTLDYFGIRSVSRAMALLFSLQSFWKTRFRINGDRGFLACLADPRSRQRKNWRSIYRCTARIDQPYLHLYALRRHWMNNRWLADRCSIPQTLNQTEFQNDLLSEIPWKVAAAKIRCDRNRQQGTDWDKCIHCWEEHIPVVQAVLLQDLIIGLAVFILDEPTTIKTKRKIETKTYITGFDLISADVETPNVTIGYRLPGRQVIINLHHQKLRGFTVVTGDGGIRAIRPIFNSQTIASWIGDPEYDEMYTTQLILKDKIKAISAKFDYCKMIDLSIA